MATKLTNTIASLLADAIDNDVNTGGAGKIRIYNGTEPATADTALSGNTLLADFALSATAFGAASNGVITLNGTPLTVAASATGTATFFRLFRNNATTVVLQGTVGTSGQQLNLNTTSITSGVNVTITSGTVTVPTS
jgi:hypothetical protein